MKLVRYDAIERAHVVTLNGREMRLDLARMRSVKPVRASRKTDTTHVYLYLCDIGAGCFKVGATCAPERRRVQIRTYAQRARMRAVVKLPPAKGAEFRRCERAVLDAFAAHRVEGGKEVLRLTHAQADDCVARMRRVASA